MKASKSVVAAGAVLVALVMTAGVAAAETEKPPRVIRVEGEHTVRSAPDRARIAVSVVSRAQTAGQASAANAKVSRDVLGRLQKAVGKPGEVRTGGYTLAAEYDYRSRTGEGDGPRLVGYVATNRFAIVSADLDGLGALIDEAVEAGANRIDSISFFLDDDEALQREALVEAGRVARGEAEAVADGLGVGLGEVVDAATVAAPRPPIAYGRMARTSEAAAPASTEILPGSLEVRASVIVTFAIR